MKNNFENIKKILIVKLCCFGDIVFITPTITALRNKFPDSEITILYSSWVKDLIPYINEIDKAILFDNPFEKSKVKLSVKALSLANKLRKENFDLAVLGHRDNSLGLLLKTAGIKYRLGFTGTKHLTHTEEFDENIHESFRYLKVLQKFKIAGGNERISLNKLQAKESLKKKTGFNENDFTVGIFPFGGINPGTEMDIKQWEFEKYIELASRISKGKNVKVVMFEGKEISEKLNNLSENFNVKEIDIDLISMCDLFITNDTGPLHIAGGFGIPTVGIFGPSDPRLVAPLNYENTTHNYIWNQPYCSPCYTPLTVRDKTNAKYWNGNEFICNTGTHECIINITVDEVFSAFKSIVSSKT